MPEEGDVESPKNSSSPQSHPTWFEPPPESSDGRSYSKANMPSSSSRSDPQSAKSVSFSPPEDKGDLRVSIDVESEEGSNHQSANRYLCTSSRSATGVTRASDWGENNESPVHSIRDEATGMESLLARTVHEAGRYSYGVVAVDVNVLSRDGTHLEVPSGGFWVDPSFIVSQPSVALSRLVDDTRDDYLSPRRVYPGVGLSGMLWVETRLDRGMDSDAHVKRSVKQDRAKRGSIFVRQSSVVREHDNGHASQALVWRNVTRIAADPDQPPDSRLQLLAQAGIGLAAGVRFNVMGHEGIVVYMTRATVDREKLASPTNVAHLCHAAHLIGSISAFEEPRRQSMSERKAEVDAIKRRVKLRLKVVQMINKRTSKEDLPEQVGPEKQASLFGSLENVGKKMTAALNEKTHLLSCASWLRKCRGTNVSPPPPLPWDQFLWTFFGSFAVFLTWSVINHALEIGTRDLSMMNGSLGSCVAAQFALWAAPASQPRNAFLSQVLAGAMVIPFNFIPGFPVWLRTSIIPALFVATMSKLGVTHPTAGGNALFYAYHGTQWKQPYGFVLFNYSLAIVMATVINNLNKRRQYPIYWGYVFDVLQRHICASKKKSEKRRTQ